MNSKLITILATCITIAACGGGGGSSSSNTPSPTPTPKTKATATTPPASGKFMHILITQGSGDLCTNANTPCVTVTVCVPGISLCDTVPNVLVDTGSYGLRVFASVLPNTASALPEMTSSGQNVAECVSYADGTSNWGPVSYAMVALSDSLFPVESVPIQLINSSFPGMAANCPGGVTTPAAFGFNGILGVGPLQTDAGIGRYFSCTSGGTCTILGSGNPPPGFVSNPIIAFGPGNNNGLTLNFGSVQSSGVYDADGYGIFGVGSNSSNTPMPGSTFNVFSIESGSGGIPINITSTLNGVFNSFLDTGSNFLYFSTDIGGITICSGGNAGLFCPSNDTSFTAHMAGLNGIGGGSFSTINFSIGNADALSNSGNTAFSNVGGNFPGIGIDWGLPFYLGRTVYMVFAGESATINSITYPASPNGYWIY